MSLPTPHRHTLQTTLAPMFGLLAAGSVAPTAWADTPAVTTNNSVLNLPEIKVDGENTSTFKVDRVTSAKISQPLLDAPQSVTIVPQQVLKEQNAQTLQEVLRNVPGITFMSGEGNLGWGDLFSIRGFSSEQSLTVDGVRDAGMSTRTDTFNLQQAEVFKGTGSIESGVSTVGGSVNLVSKEAHLGDANKVSAGIGTDSYRRLTADLNKQINDTTAVRINLMKHYNQVADRDDVDYDRWGIATSFGFGLGTDTRFFVDTFYQKDTNTPDGGVPIQRGTDGHRMPGVKRSNWYGDSSLYTQENETTSLTARLEHDFDWNEASLRNQTRWERSDNFAVLSPARFFAAGANGKKTCSGTRCATLGYTGVGPISQVPGSTVNAYTDYVNNSNTGYGILRGSDFGLSKRYTILDNQTDFSFKFNTGSLQHAVVSGLEFYHETYGGLKRNAEVPAGDMFFDMNNPSHSFASTYVTKGEGDPRSVIDNAGIYAGDTVTLNEQWQVLGSLRYDNWHAQTTQRGQANISSTDGAVSGRVGAVYKPLPNGSIYVSYSEAAQPSALGASTNNQIYGAATTSNYSPAKSKTYEMGTKWVHRPRHAQCHGGDLPHRTGQRLGIPGRRIRPGARPARQARGRCRAGLARQYHPALDDLCRFLGTQEHPDQRHQQRRRSQERARPDRQPVDHLCRHRRAEPELRRAIRGPSPLQRQQVRRRAEQQQQLREWSVRSERHLRTRQRESTGLLAEQCGGAIQGQQGHHGQPQPQQCVQQVLLQPGRRVPRRFPALRHPRRRTHPHRQCRL